MISIITNKIKEICFPNTPSRKDSTYFIALSAIALGVTAYVTYRTRKHLYESEASDSYKSLPQSPLRTPRLGWADTVRFGDNGEMVPLRGSIQLTDRAPEHM